MPDVWSYSGVGIETHHNSEDKPDTVDPRSLHDLITIIASYLYFNANAGETQVPWLADIHLTTYIRKWLRLLRLHSTPFDPEMRRREAMALIALTYLQDRGHDALLSVLRLVPAGRRDALRQSLAPELKQLQVGQ